MRIFATAFAVILTLCAPLAAQTFSEEDIKELVLEAIRENPGIVVEAVAILEKQREEAKASAQAIALKDQRAFIERDPNAPVLGNPEGDVTVVEFFDYNCPYCKRSMAEVQTLLSKDKDIRLVYREWPILGDGSVFAAKAALAARKQGKYEEFHWALMSFKGPAQEATVIRVAKDVGLDVEQLRSDMGSPEVNAHIEDSMRLAQALGFNGTPSFVIGDNLVGGFIALDQLEAHVEGARSQPDQ